jgi:hypothetical protein
MESDDFKRGVSSAVDAFQRGTEWQVLDFGGR